MRVQHFGFSLSTFSIVVGETSFMSYISASFKRIDFIIASASASSAHFLAPRFPCTILKSGTLIPVNRRDSTLARTAFSQNSMRSEALALSDSVATSRTDTLSVTSSSVRLLMSVNSKSIVSRTKLASAVQVALPLQNRQASSSGWR